MSTQDDEISDAVAGSEYFLSPEPQEIEATTPRVSSSQSLAGEDIALPIRSFLDGPIDPAISLFTTSEETQTPPIRPSRFSSAASAPKASGPPMNRGARSPPANARPPRIPNTSTTLPQANISSGNRHGRGGSDIGMHLGLPSVRLEPFTVPKRRTLSWDNSDPYTNERRRVLTFEDSQVGSGSTSIRSTPDALLQPILSDDAGVPVTSISLDPNHRQGDAPTTPVSMHSFSFSGGFNNNSSNSDTESSTPIWNPAAGFDTGSFVRQQSLNTRLSSNVGSTGKSPQKQGNPIGLSDYQRISPDARGYTLDDVVGAYPPESNDETILMSRIDAERRTSGHFPPADSFSHVLPEIAKNFSYEDETKGPEAKKETSENENKVSFSDVARKLMDASPKAFASKERGHHRTKTETGMFAGDKMYEAAENLFGQQASSLFSKPSEEDDAEDENPRKWHHTFRPRLERLRKRAREDAEYFVEFLGPHKPSIREELVGLVKWIALPSLLVAFFLFYILGNPPTGKGEDATEDPTATSLSWWFVFMGVRQTFTLELARLTQLVVIDFLTFRTTSFPRLIGPSLSLMVAMSKGWPFVLSSWALWDILLLFGEARFHAHWLYWQHILGLFNESNPDGGVTGTSLYQRFVVAAFLVGIAVTVKRTVMGNVVGHRVVRNYRSEMASMMQKLVLLTDLSLLCLSKSSTEPNLGQTKDTKGDRMRVAVEVAGFMGATSKDDESFRISEAPSFPSTETKEFTASAHLQMADLLEQWEEPELQNLEEEAFGSIRNREDCIESAQKLFDCLHGDTPGPFLEFDVLCSIAKDDDGNINSVTAKELVRLFRPDRNGQLSKLDFVKSIDSVYKNLRLLLASIKNATQIDKAYESLVNVAFYTCVWFIVMGVLGVDVQALVISASGVIVSFSFMIGTASANYLEGILFVLVRRPFDIGDRINVNTVVSQPDAYGGESSWIVEKVDLYSTTARLGTTREQATFSNSSLATMRIINMNRSEKPNVCLDFKFPFDSTMQQRQIFKTRMITYIKDRPREWIKVVSFRSTRVEVDLGFVAFVLIVQHREKWQNLNAILVSRGDLISYAVELQKELEMNYKAPHVPIDLRHVEGWPDKQYWQDEPKKER
eukprot:Nitzschia sp. Nitz4//scaffold1_size375055//116805//120596//NITZ4_000247-RA/size375055-augustus-gene-0.711-mRNA-1//-1//CDS//3329540958//590//frame0